MNKIECVGKKLIINDLYTVDKLLAHHFLYAQGFQKETGVYLNEVRISARASVMVMFLQMLNIRSYLVSHIPDT